MGWNFSTDPLQPQYKPIPMSKIRLNAKKDLAKEGKIQKQGSSTVRKTSSLLINKDISGKHTRSPPPSIPSQVQIEDETQESVQKLRLTKKETS